ncbi:hypothetical protein GOZ90_16135 [Agrobacterium vitis]|uniref:Lipoprotein n=1 Tax=Agrobacterium vitis TaxID=373 RepID=A0A6L6VH76_AGRVI|nr:hypothetical protein [Agrobacterium vitis]MUZ74218.1 hypothetical protein [Agrobacterium vitis]
MKRLVAFFATAVICQSCASSVIETTKDRNKKSDAPLMGYYLPKAQIPVTATFDGEKNSLTLSYSSTPNIVPDIRDRYYIRFHHEVLSSDQLTVSAPDGLLEKVSTTTSDNTSATIEGLNTVLEKSEKLNKLRINNSDVIQQIISELNKEPKPCAGAQSIFNIDFIKPEQPERQDITEIPGCKLVVTASLTALGNAEDLFPTLSETEAEAAKKCPNCLYFRTSRAYKVSLRAHLEQGKNISHQIKNSFTVMAPDLNTLAYVQFKRHPFVDSNQSLEFNKGVLKGISVSRPSEAVGFLKLPAAGLATAIAIKSLD